MPIFTSRFSPNRVAGAILQRIRSQSNQANERAEQNTTRREQRQSERTAGSNDTQQTSTRERETLLARTQLGQRIAEQLQSLRENIRTNTNNDRASEQSSASEDEQSSPTNTRQTNTTTQTNNNRSPIETRLQTPIGVGIRRTEADEDVERPGRLNRAPANPIRERQLDGFARLRAVASGILSQRNNRSQPSANNIQNQTEDRTQALNNRRQNQGRGLARGQGVAERQGAITIQTPTEQQTPLAIQATTRQTPSLLAPQVATPESPSAEAISRANTTEEIRKNLQQDAGEVARGLTRDSTRQLQETTQQTAQNAERVAENQRTETQTEGREEIRELEVEERQLERELQQTQQNIRQERIRVQQSQSSASRSTTSSAAAIGTQVNILAE